MVGSVELASVRFDRSQTAGEACTVEQGRTGDNAAGGDGVSPFLRATGSVLWLLALAIKFPSAVDKSDSNPAENGR
jgi:hypothetical protein